MKGGFIEALPGPFAGWTADARRLPGGPANLPGMVENPIMIPSDARTEILRRIQAATADVPEYETAAQVAVPRAYRLIDEESHERAGRRLRRAGRRVPGDSSPGRLGRLYPGRSPRPAHPGVSGGWSSPSTSPIAGFPKR